MPRSEGAEYRLRERKDGGTVGCMYGSRPVAHPIGRGDSCCASRARFRALAESQLYEEYNVSVGQESRLGRGRKAREQKEKKIEDGSGKQSDVQRPRVER